MKKLLRLLFSRMALVILCLLLQIALLLVFLHYFQEFYIYFSLICFTLTGIAILILINNNCNPGYKIAWIIPMLLFPIFGGVFYLIMGGNKVSRRMQRKLKHIERKMCDALPPSQESGDMLRDMAVANPTAANQSTYLADYAHCPPYRSTYTEYLPIGEVKFQRLKEELHKAKHYIFLEYFIIQEGVMWNEILDILKQKVREGVDVRVIYDDIGCIMLLPYKYNRHLEKMGIKCCVFNPFRPILSARFNNRDHRKIAVIDGHTGFTGGINLADEYINAYERFGHWKDTSILLKGDAVWSLTVMFLSMWSYLRHVEEDYDQFRPYLDPVEKTYQKGYVQPFTDSPWDNETIGENVYLNLINRASHYVYITTPYLVVDHEIITALSTAAKSGVDVRIITPHIPDKKYVHEVTRAHYGVLIKNGVKIYEYTPGFIHSKTFCVDDQYAVVGTINLDYRSLYLHMECGVWMHGTDSIVDIKRDFFRTLRKCEQISLAHCRQVRWYRRLIRSVLRVFAPLM